MFKTAVEIVLALAVLITLPYILYFFLWLGTRRGIPPRTDKLQGNSYRIGRAEEAWALKTVGVSAMGVGIFRAIMFLWAR
jgi:hypothetical protein